MFRTIKLRNRSQSQSLMKVQWSAVLLAAGWIWSGSFSFLQADAPRVLPKGQLPNDSRLAPLKDLDGYFPFDPPASREAWAKRSEHVRRQILVTQGLWPMPAKTPLNPVIHGRIERDQYTVEKVYFESYPGFFVTGNLYRPKGKTGPLPGVLCPHGHWPDGRFYDNANQVRNEIVQGAERFEEGGRSPLQARCVQLARMGCVVFHYDMIGYADSVQLSFDLAHRFAKQRPEMNTTDNWGLFSPQAEARFQSVMGLQTYNSIRALDFLLGLPEVDASRIGITGASGGGTQTFLLCAIDPRPTLAFPAVMVSTAMQGGCTCENACGLRIGTGNVEFAALFAPKPQGLTAADDWTKEMAAKGFPQLKQLYQLMGAPENVMLKPLVHFGHNYNYVSRAAMYSWVNKHFKLGLTEPIVEEDYKRLTREEMTVWDSQHPKPEQGPEFERKLLRWITDDAQSQLHAARESKARYQDTVRPAVEIMIGRSLKEVGQVGFELKDKNERGGYLELTGSVRNQTHKEELPAVFFHPKEWNGQTVLWIDGRGKQGLFTSDGKAIRPVQQLVDRGITVVGVDLLFQGEFLADGKPVDRTRRVKNTREFAGYTFGYNHTVFAQRVHDVLTMAQFILNHEQHRSSSLHLVAVNGAGAIAAAARAQAPQAFKRAAIDSAGFRFGKLLDIHDPNFLPGGAKYDDLPGLLAIAAPEPLWISGEKPDDLTLVRDFYKQAGAEKNLTISDATDAPAAAVQWLLN